MSVENDKWFKDALDKLKEELELIEPSASGDISKISPEVRYRHQVIAYNSWVDPPIKYIRFDFDMKKRKK